MTLIRDAAALNLVREAGLAKILPRRPRIAVGMGTCGTGNGSEGVYHAFADAIGKRGLDIHLVQKAASASAPRNRWSMSGVRDSRWSCCAVSGRTR
jgi:hypothetical protein